MSSATPIPYVKGDAYGNDFLLVKRDALRDSTAAAFADLARAMCERQAGVGADGLMAWEPCAGGASMELRNADGSPAEVSGNGVRCLAALLVEQRVAGGRTDDGVVTIATAGGDKVLTLLDSTPPRYTFRAHMGAPRGLTEETLAVGTERVRGGHPLGRQPPSASSCCPRWRRRSGGSQRSVQPSLRTRALRRGPMWNSPWSSDPIGSGFSSGSGE